MSAPVLDPRPHSDAVKAAVDEQLDVWKAYDYGEVPGDEGNPDESERNKPLPNLYAIVSIEQVPSAGQRMSGQTGTTQWIADIRGVGRTVREAEFVLWKACEALHEQILMINDRATEPLQRQIGQAPEPDGGRFSGRVVFTYSH